MNNVILKKRVSKKVIGMTVGFSNPEVLIKFDTGVKIPKKVIGMTVGFDTVKILIPVLNTEGMKKFE